jgi:transposase
MVDLTGLGGSFAALLRPADGNSARLDALIGAVRAADLPQLHTFARGLELDHDAVHAAVTMPYDNGGTEGVNTKTKGIMRQMHGRAGFTLLRHRILLN